MAKQSGGKGGTAHIRFIMLDAEIPEGDLSQITQAIQNALKPTHIIQQRTIVNGTSQGSLAPPSTSAAEIEEAVDVEGGAEAFQAPPKKPREARAKRVSSPEVVLDLDLNTDPAWVSYAEEKSPSTITDKCLVVAEWCKRHRGLDEISADHVFTCFRRVGWSTSIADFPSMLRSCKGRDYMSSGTQRAHYAINHLGSSRVDEMSKK
jgi:hypothetical protein